MSAAGRNWNDSSQAGGTRNLPFVPPYRWAGFDPSRLFQRSGSRLQSRHRHRPRPMPTALQLRAITTVELNRFAVVL